MSATYVRAKHYEDKDVGSEEKTGVIERSKHYLVQFSLKNDPGEARIYVEACFGKNMYPQTEQERIEREICVDKHKNCHVLFTRGRSGWKEKQKSETKLKELSEIERKRERQEILEFQKESAQQYERNKQYYEKNRVIYRNSIRKLTEKLRICLETQDETFPEMATHGKINPR